MKKNNKGFTLAELLIVVAIIAVLVAIAIPVFTTQLEKSRESTDIANLRAAYAAGTTAALTGYYGTNELGSTATLYYNPSIDGSLDTSATIKIGQGTATDGKSDISLISQWSNYDTTSDVKNYGIKVTFENKMLKSVDFEAIP